MNKRINTLLKSNLKSEVAISANAKKMNAKAHNQSPYGTPEPSTKTEFK